MNGYVEKIGYQRIITSGSYQINFIDTVKRRIMKLLFHQVYTQYLNRKLNQSGRIRLNHFFFCIVENDEYLWIVARPIKVGLVDYAEDYRWSSARAHLKLAQNDLLQEPSWLDETDRSRGDQENLESAPSFPPLSITPFEIDLD